MIPEQEGVLVRAAGWIVDVQSGRAASIVSVLAIATLGLLMMSGRLSLRRGAVVILGCFIVFSAGTIAPALVGTPAAPAVSMQAAEEPVSTYRPATPRPVPYDPYAGASVPAQPTQPALR